MSETETRDAAAAVNAYLLDLANYYGANGTPDVIEYANGTDDTAPLRVPDLLALLAELSRLRDLVEAVQALGNKAQRDTPAPVVSGGQADGEGERRLSDDVWMPRETLAERVKADGRLYTAGYEDGEAAALAARPVLSREAVRERVDALVDGFIRKWVSPDLHGHLLDNDDNDGQRLRDALAAVLVGQEGR